MPEMWDEQREQDSHYFIPSRHSLRWRFIIDDYGEGYWWHQCLRCEKWLRQYKFTWKRSRNMAQAVCKKCHAAEAAVRRLKISEDPEQERLWLERQRFSYRRRQERRGVQPIPQRGTANLKYGRDDRHIMLSPQPISEWLQRRLRVYDGVRELAKACGTHERVITRLIKMEHTEVRADTIDNILIHEGTCSLAILYPLDEEAA